MMKEESHAEGAEGGRDSREEGGQGGFASGMTIPIGDPRPGNGREQEKTYGTTDGHR